MQSLVRVMVVDDYPDIVEVLEDSLRQRGFDVCCAGSADEAFRLATEHRKTLTAIVTDIQMPGRSGIDLIQQLRAAGFNTPIIAVTGGTEAWLDAARGAGANAAFFKPVDLDDLEKTLRDLIAARPAATSDDSKDCRSCA